MIKSLEQCLLKTWQESRDLIHNFVPRTQDPPSPLEFYRDWVSTNSPFILENGVSHWPAIGKWSCDHLRDVIPEKKVTVAVTPNGYADAVCEGKFVMPEEREMKMKDFLDVLERKDAHDDVYYIQKQNSNLLSDFSELMTDIEVDIPWATEAFNKKQDAVNFWMGQKEAVTSLHKDPYENLYAVISGEKTFTLHPPCDRPFIPYKDYKSAVFEKREGEWSIKECQSSGLVPWIPVDPLCPDFDTYPMYETVKPITCTLKPGDLLYLPSLWFHHVTQADKTIAVNFWYDMEFDIKYSYYRTLDEISKNCLNR